ncbi:MAG: rhomboid family intramembrane serine protease, partial [Fimbriimonas ginsengisoli]|nr:rhomboid family intramembrane serine protease [Fimbriimonas ginsengisoli]
MSGQRRLPIATLLLIAANLAAAFGLLWQSVLPEEFGFHPERPSFGSAITSLFLHQNLMHLLGNMVFLAAVGAAVEIATGTFRFVVVYFASGLAGVGLYAAMFVPVSGPEPSTLIGASGAVAGCVGYYSAKYITVRVPVWPGVTASVAFLTSLWALLQIAGALIPLGGVVPTTAYSAHLGGLAMGLIASLLFRAPDLGDRRLGHVLLDRMSDRSAAASLATAMRHLEAHPNDVKALRDLADAAGAMGDR